MNPLPPTEHFVQGKVRVVGWLRCFNYCIPIMINQCQSGLTEMVSLKAQACEERLQATMNGEMD